MDNIEYAEHMMKMCKEDIIDYKTKGDTERMLKANGKYYAYKDMIHYLRERKKKSTKDDSSSHIADISGCFCDHEFIPVKSIVEKCHKCGEIKITIGAK